ncbi:MAG: hypothetical protein IPH04_21125 [Saprospirales bacterium]|jgi:uncharacterized protein YoxC|nr:hypothetical protein [Saprospirales bacterium]MBK6905227.1 hypothetical protein [Saprospirales bacterium]MBK7335107.1 hypothetical protein [Saprospirales bacterium]
MIKTIIQLAVVLVLFLLVYNYFMGTGEEKQNAKEIFREMKDVGVAVKDLLKSEKEKFDSGKYDNAIEKMRLLISNLETNAREVAPEYVDRIQNLEEKRKDLEGQLDRAKNTTEVAGEQAEKVKELNQDMDQLMQETEQIMEEIKRKSEPD